MTDYDGVVTTQDMQGLTITAAKVQPSVISIPNANQKPLVTIHPDGHLEFGDDYQPDEAAQAFWDAVQRLAPSAGDRTFGPQLHSRINAELKAGQESEQNLAKLRDEVAGMCNCCLTNRPHLGRMRELLGMATDGFLADPEEEEG